MLGLAPGWKQDREFQTLEEGASTYVYAAFDPDITGKRFPVSASHYTYLPTYFACLYIALPSISP